MIDSVLKQGFRAEFIHHEAGVRCFNSGMLARDGQLYLATRRGDARSSLHDIVINKLDGVSPTPITTVNLPRVHGREQFEDARLFMHAGKIHMSYVEGRYWERPWLAVQKLAVLDNNWRVEKVVEIEFGDNGFGKEKNWQFFSRNRRLYFVYSIAPHITVELDKNYKVRKKWIVEVEIPFMGMLRGGTPPQHIRGGYQSFVHFHTEHFTRNRRYAVCSYRFRDKPPFSPYALSEVLMRASEEDPGGTNLDTPEWNPLVIFPTGIVRRKDHWLVSAGVNDSSEVLIEFPLNIPHKPVPSYLREWRKL
jgi:hypothetical protein